MHTSNADTITGNVTTQPLPLSAVRIPDHLPLPSCLRPAALLSAPAQCVAHGYTDKHTRVSTPKPGQVLRTLLSGCALLRVCAAAGASARAAACLIVLTGLLARTGMAESVDALTALVLHGGLLHGVALSAAGLPSDSG